MQILRFLCVSPVIDRPVSTSYILMDYNTSAHYQHAMLGSYLAVVGLGVVLIVIGISIRCAPSFFVRSFGSKNMRNAHYLKISDPKS